MLGRKKITPKTKINIFFVDAAFLAMTALAVGASAQVNQQGQLELAAQLEQDHADPAEQARPLEAQVLPIADAGAGVAEHPGKNQPPQRVPA